MTAARRLSAYALCAMLPVVAAAASLRVYIGIPAGDRLPLQVCADGRCDSIMLSPGEIRSVAGVEFVAPDFSGPVPTTMNARIVLEECAPARGVIVVDGGEPRQFRPGIRSTGRLTYELIERPGTCPPAPPAPPCPDPEPCEPPQPTPDPPPPGEPGWEMIHRAPKGWSWTAGDEVPAEIFELRVPIGGSYRGLRVSYEVAVDWSRCRELPGPSPSPKCLGMYITESGRADQVFSYLMAKGSGVVHRHGFVDGWSPSRKPKASSPIRLLDGATYRIEHEIRDGSVTVSVLRDGEGASVLRPPNACSPAPCFPVSFSGPVVLKAGWRGDEPVEVGGTMGWSLSGLMVEVRRE